MRTGLIVGKFAPLHKGHQYLIETAYSRVDELVVVVYDAPDITPVSIDIRASWIRKLYPNSYIIEGKNIPKTDSWNREYMLAHAVYIMRLLHDCKKRITHVFSSESYGDYLARALKAQHVLVDKERAHVPVSATMIRENMQAYRAFLPNIVYRDLF